ncbi:MAG TPA: hypothetical protein PK135_06680 [Arenimonas sp.]|nr:hypothetical protein [Arenimonas sp.]
MQSSPNRRRFLKNIGITTAALMLPMYWTKANAMQLPAGTPWQQPGTWIPPTQFQYVPKLSDWLNQHPNVRDAITWERTDLVMSPYASWGRSQSSLNDAYIKAFRGYASGLPKVPVNIAPTPDSATMISTADAWDLYLAHVAHSLAIEIRGDLPWSITQMSANELKVLFDSRQFFSRNVNLGTYQFNGVFGGGFTALAPPDYVYSFLQLNDIPNQLKLAAGQTNTTVLYDAKARAYSRLLSWCGDKMSHFLVGSTSSANMQAHWQYNGCPPVARVIEGTINASYSPTLRHWTAGCFGTTAFLRAVARTMNIAIEIKYLPPLGHTTPYVPALDAYLSHGDDPYNSFAAFSDKVVGTNLSYPKSLLFISSATHDAWWFSAGLSDTQKINNVGRRVSEIAVAYLPLGLLISYIFDMSQGFSHANGTVAQYLSKTYTVAQLEAMNLWQKMDGKIAVLGGAEVLKAINDEAQLEKET